MSTLFEYDKTEVEEGYYILRVSCDGLTFLTVAQFMLGGWYITGADYDMWRWSDGEKPKIEIICGLDLDKIAVAAEAEEPLSPVDSRDALIERLAKQIVQGVCELQEVPDPDHPDAIIVTVDDLEAVICNRLSAALSASPSPVERLRSIIDKHELWKAADADHYNVSADHLAAELAALSSKEQQP